MDLESLSIGLIANLITHFMAKADTADKENALKLDNELKNILSSKSINDDIDTLISETLSHPSWNLNPQILMNVHEDIDLAECFINWIYEIDPTKRNNTKQNAITRIFELMLINAGNPDDEIKQKIKNLSIDIFLSLENNVYNHQGISNLRRELYDQKQIKKIDEIISRLDIKEDIKAAVEKLFLDILQKENIPQRQWAEKFQEIAKKHQELLDKWQIVESGDPQVDNLRIEARKKIETGDYDKSDQLLQKAFEIDQEAIRTQQEKLDQRKISIAQTLASRAELAKTKPNYKLAISLYQESLDNLPNNHEEIQALYMNNMGILYHYIAEYDMAFDLFNRALAIDEKTFGKDHPNVARDINNIGGVYQNKGELDKALEFYQRALVIDEKSFGKDHPNVARDVNNIGIVYWVQNELDKALKFLQRTLAIDEKSFGSDHPNVAIYVNNIGGVYAKKGELNKALEFYLRALAIFEKNLGKDHPNVAALVNNIGIVYKAKCELDKALKFLQRALAIDEKIFGKDHPNVAMDVYNIGMVYKDKGKKAKAKVCFKRAYLIWYKFLGPEHKKTNYALNSYLECGGTKEELMK